MKISLNAKWLKKITLRSSQKRVFIIIALILALAVVFLFVGLRNKEVISALYHFKNTSPYSSDIVLFYDTNCSHCTRVDDFIKNNDVEKNIKFIRLEVRQNSLNTNILEDKVQICGLDFEQIGVPFLWDGENKQCLMGYVDIINFFLKFAVKN